ncbi:MAG: hypothetical protein H6841_04915 [Planctomycetes bacterium]|nr:hypothetical protein [Planctomycetota bacterium]MCB9934955.1 hypothetical protein [Planctomycetota bacterium]
MRNLSAILYILLLAACASSVPADPVAPPSSADIYIRVDGMTRVQGIT